MATQMTEPISAIDHEPDATGLTSKLPGRITAGTPLESVAQVRDRSIPPDPVMIHRVLKDPTPRTSSSTIPVSRAYEYEHRLASVGSNEVHLLELLPGSGAESLVCEFHIASLDDSPKYETVSYCWGQPINFDAEIVISRKGSLAISTTLHRALSRLRFQDRSRLLWADMACVKQQDIEERTVQVQLMHRVYRECQGVLIWLGDGSEQSDLGMSVVEAVCAGLRKKKQAGDDRLVYDLHRSDRTRYGLFAEGSKELAAMTALLDRPWFGRAWVVQELALPPAATLLCGTKSIQWDDFALAINSCSPSMKKFTTNENPGENHVRLSMCPSRVEACRGDAISPKLISLVARARNSKATDPRDKIFAFVGLAREQGQPGTLGRPDYRLNAQEIYRAFVLENISAYGDLDVFSLVHGRCPDSLAQSTLKLPSWVPDLSADGMPYPLTRLDKMAVESHATLRTKNDYLQYAASKGSRAEYRLSDDGNTMTLPGYIIDTVEQLGLAFPGRSEWSDPRRKVQTQRNAWASWEALVGVRDSETARDVYLQVMRGGELQQHLEAARRDFETGYEEPLAPYRAVSRGRVVHSAGAFAALHGVAWAVLVLQNAYRRLAGRRAIEYKRGIGTNPCEYRRMGRLSSGAVGLFPGATRPGDCVALLQGGKVAFILRANKSDNAFRLIGEAYVHGIMEGEAWEASRCESISLE